MNTLTLNTLDIFKTLPFKVDNHFSRLKGDVNLLKVNFERSIYNVPCLNVYQIYSQANFENTYLCSDLKTAIIAGILDKKKMHTPIHVTTFPDQLEFLDSGKLVFSVWKGGDLFHGLSLPSEIDEQIRSFKLHFQNLGGEEFYLDISESFRDNKVKINRGTFSESNQSIEKGDDVTFYQIFKNPLSIIGIPYTTIKIEIELNDPNVSTNGCHLIYGIIHNNSHRLIAAQKSYHVNLTDNDFYLLHQGTLSPVDRDKITDEVKNEIQTLQSLKTL